MGPILPVRDLIVSLEHSRRLGFTTGAHDMGRCGYPVLDDAAVHLGGAAAPRLDWPLGSLTDASPRWTAGADLDAGSAKRWWRDAARSTLGTVQDR